MVWFAQTKFPSIYSYIQMFNFVHPPVSEQFSVAKIYNIVTKYCMTKNTCRPFGNCKSRPIYVGLWEHVGRRLGGTSTPRWWGDWCGKKFFLVIKTLGEDWLESSTMVSDGVYTKSAKKNLEMKKNIKLMISNGVQGEKEFMVKLWSQTLMRRCDSCSNQDPSEKKTGWSPTSQCPRTQWRRFGGRLSPSGILMGLSISEIMIC